MTEIGEEVCGSDHEDLVRQVQKALSGKKPPGFAYAVAAAMHDMRRQRREAIISLSFLLVESRPRNDWKFDDWVREAAARFPGLTDYDVAEAARDAADLCHKLERRLLDAAAKLERDAP